MLIRLNVLSPIALPIMKISDTHGMLSPDLPSGTLVSHTDSHGWELRRTFRRYLSLQLA